MGQLQAVNGIGPQYGELIVRAGIRTLGELADQKPGPLRKRIEDYHEGLDVRVTGGNVSEDMLEDWIGQARDIVAKHPEVAAVGSR
jgi:predicted flap endonuclease-1-like 5' DNA nuclease